MSNTRSGINALSSTALVWCSHAIEANLRPLKAEEPDGVGTYLGRSGGVGHQVGGSGGLGGQLAKPREAEVT